MLEYELTEQSERRGRFLIQEIEEEEADVTQKGPHKRPKHSSIIMDSKFIHTTHMDSNDNNETFSTFVWEETGREWVDFNAIWKKFSKYHVDVVEDDMEKIFHYIDNRIDDSDFFYKEEAEFSLQKGKSEEHDKLAFKTLNDPEKYARGEYVPPGVIRNKTKINLQFNANFTSDKFVNRSFVFTNFCGPSIVSPAVSPINSNKKLISLAENNSNELQMKERHKLNGISTPIKKHEKKRPYTLSENQIGRSKNMFENFVRSSQENKLTIERNSYFTLTPENKCNNFKDKNFQIVNECNFTQKEVETVETVEKHTIDHYICCVCKHKII